MSKRLPKALKLLSPINRGILAAVLVGVIATGVYIQHFGRAANLVGDVNGDNVVNVLDLSLLLANWNTNYSAADFKADGTINIFDLSMLLNGWGKTGPTTTPTPIPTATVSPTASPSVSPCAAGSTDIIVVLDNSGSMGQVWNGTGTRLDQLKTVASNFINTIHPSSVNRVGIINFSDQPTLLSPLSGDAAALTAAIATLQPAGGTKYVPPLQMAQTMFASPLARPGAVRKIMVFVSDGEANDYPDPAQTAAAVNAELVKLTDSIIYTVGITADGSPLDLLQSMPRNGGVYGSASTPQALSQIFNTVTDKLQCAP